MPDTSIFLNTPDAAGGEKGAFYRWSVGNFAPPTEAKARIGLNGSCDDESPDDGSG
jgi:hypothetical protein